MMHGNEATSPAGNKPPPTSEEFTALWHSLAAHPGRIALVAGPGSRELVISLANTRGRTATPVSQYLVSGGDHLDPIKGLRDTSFLIDLEILFWSDVAVDPLRMLTALANSHPVFAQWPGEIASRRGAYSRPGRSDYYDQALPPEAVVLRPLLASFLDELPYVVERIS